MIYSYETGNPFCFFNRISDLPFFFFGNCFIRSLQMTNIPKYTHTSEMTMWLCEANMLLPKYFADHQDLPVSFTFVESEDLIKRCWTDECTCFDNKQKRLFDYFTKEVICAMKNSLREVTLPEQDKDNILSINEYVGTKAEKLSYLEKSFNYCGCKWKAILSEGKKDFFSSEKYPCFGVFSDGVLMYQSFCDSISKKILNEKIKEFEDSLGNS